MAETIIPGTGAPVAVHQTVYVPTTCGPTGVLGEEDQVIGPNIPPPEPDTPDGWIGNVEVDMLNPCGAIDNRRPTQATGGTFNNLPICHGGRGFLRLGLDAPCGSNYDIYRALWRFPLTVDRFNQPVPVVAGLAQFKLSSRPDLHVGHTVTGIRNVNFYWVDLTGPFPFGDPGQAGSALPESQATSLMTLATNKVIINGVAKVIVDVTAAYNQARAANRADMWILARITDESNDSVGGSRYYTIVAREHPDPAQWPRLELTKPSPQTAKVPVITVEFSTLESCVTIGDRTLPDSPERTDLVPEAEGLRPVRRGNTVYVEVDLRDLLAWPGVPTDATTVTVSIFKPDGSVLVTDALMARIAFSRYAYDHTTQTSDPLGVYTASFEVTV